MMPGPIQIELIEASGDEARYVYRCAEFGEGRFRISISKDVWEAEPSEPEPEDLRAGVRAMVKVRKLYLETGEWV